MEPLRVRDVMTRHVEHVLASERLGVAALLRRFGRFHHLPVLDERRRVVGMLTPTDVLAEASKPPGRRPLFVRDLMSSPAETVDASDPLEVAARRMIDAGIHSLAVTGRSGELLGIVTATDLVRALAGGAAVPERIEDVPVDDLMTRDVVTVGPDATVADAAAALAEAGVRHLPVVDADGTLVGIVSERDLRSQLGAELMRWPHSPTEQLRESIVALMAPNPTALKSGTPLARAFDAFADERLSAVPIVDDRDRLEGILSYVDVLRWLRDRAVGRAATMAEAWSIEP